MSIKTCVNGHARTPESTVMVQGYPRCKPCDTMRKRAYAARDLVPADFDGAAFDAKHAIRPTPADACCARCRRGTRAFGVWPCGFNRECACHG